MSNKKTKRDIWDVLFSLKDIDFPLSKDYLNQPRGSVNSINCQVNIQPNKNYLDFASKLNPTELYAVDFSLNYFVRLVFDYNDILIEDSSKLVKEYFEGDLEKILNHCTKTDNFDFYLKGLELDIYEYQYNRHYYDKKNELILEDEEFEIGYYMRQIALVQFSLEYYIEHSNLDWQTKAEAFLRSQCLTKFKDSDDEALIYLESKDFLKLIEYDKFNITDITYKKIKKLASEQINHNIDVYHSRWDIIGFNLQSPFQNKKRDLSCLRFKDLTYLNYIYQLLYLSEKEPIDEEKICYLLNIFRTDISVIDSHLKSLYEHLKNYLNNKIIDNKWVYPSKDDIIASTKCRLFFVLFALIYFRLPENQQDESLFEYCLAVLKSNPYKGCDDSSFVFCNFPEESFSDEIDLTTFFEPSIFTLCFNAKALWLLKCDEYEKSLYSLFDKIKECQLPYGYWTDEFCNSEFTTALALEILDIGSGRLTYPTNKIDLQKTTVNTNINQEHKPYVEFDFNSRFLTVGLQKIPLSTSILKLFYELIRDRYSGYPVAITDEFKNARDFLRKKLKDSKNLKYIILSVSVFQTKSKGYQLHPDVVIKNGSDIRPQQSFMDNNDDIAHKF